MRKMPAGTCFTGLPILVEHMIRTDQLIVVRRIENPAGMPALSAPFINFQQDGRRKLVIEIVQMHHIRLKVIQHQSNLSGVLRRNKWS